MPPSAAPNLVCACSCPRPAPALIHPLSWLARLRQAWASRQPAAALTYEEYARHDEYMARLEHLKDQIRHRHFL